MKSTFIFIRHAKSRANELGIVQGRGDAVELTDEGRAQSLGLAERFAGTKIDKFFSSGAKRAVDTLEPLRSKHGAVPYQVIEDLHERSKGEAEGMLKTAFAEKYPEIVKSWSRGEDAKVPGGEAFEDVHSRVFPIIESHAKQADVGSTYLYVTHGNVIKTLLGAMLGVPYSLRPQIMQGYCAVNIVVYDHQTGRWQIECINK